MRRGGRPFIVAGVGLALVAALLAVLALSGGSDDASPESVPTSGVVQAARDVPANTVLREEDVVVAEVDQGAVSPGAATSPSQVVGLAVNGDLVQGQQVLLANLTTPGLTNLVAGGKRAVAIPVDRVSALGGLIRAEDYIDVIYSTRLNLQAVLPTSPVEVTDATQGYAQDDTLTLPSYGAAPETRYPYPGDPGSRVTVRDTQDGNPVTKVLLQDLRVLRVIAGDVAVESQPASPSGDSEATPEGRDATAESERLPAADLIVVEVDPQQAEWLKFFLDNEGSFQIALRGQGDHNQVATDGTTYDRLVGEFGLPVPRTVQLPSGGQE